MATLTLEAARRLATDALIRCGTAAPAADSTARALVGAEADGLKGHGLSRVAPYAAQVRTGKVVGDAEVRVAQPRPGLLAVDAGHGFAYPALDAALDALPGMARAQGIAAAGIRRSHHCGAAGRPVEALAEQGCIALLFANTPAAMAPWGGSRAVFGTNPLAFACPLPGRAPIVVDLALSKVARANIVGAAKRGDAIPEGWALDAEGRPTTDAAAALNGTMVPLGDAKGTALALMVEVLAAGLVGARYAAEASSFLDAAGDPPGTGQFLIAIDAGGLSEDAPDRFAALAAAIEEQDGARLPGARRLALRARAAAEGLNVPDALVAEIEAL
ncbi:Ldh family oxidoreductase [Methylobacterium dankookense]|uniref:(2R)-3-sulfolactate dehydrogenase (NADP(+)) n=1 Tax=Methylobacterium dankookense TaxID=560405 RepID=A0A564G5V0_9HYPH|nr:Ldh family oxidoreductase [Methylobacterium dankookense]GJD59534.1 (2R)-3-sulfolactate dehydrogenase (NADP(+)) [Methylobacterium dankookense]VUF15909.1 (2R)-3-sulfolactate dehydrogenase (NADP(+)) [Methylobacterium dankookense]